MRGGAFAQPGGRQRQDMAFNTQASLSDMRPPEAPIPPYADMPPERPYEPQDPQIPDQYYSQEPEPQQYGQQYGQQPDIYGQNPYPVQPADPMAFLNDNNPENGGF